MNQCRNMNFKKKYIRRYIFLSVFRPRKLKIHHYISIIAILALIPMLFLGITLSYNFIQKGNELRNQHLASVGQVHREIDTFIQTYLVATETLAKQAVEMNLAPEELGKALLQVVEHYEGFDEIYLDTPDFQVSSRIPAVTDTYRETKRKQLFSAISTTEFFALGKPFISPLTKDITAEDTIIIATPIKNRAGVFYGYIMGSLDLPYLQRTVNRHQIYPSSYTVLVDSANNFFPFPYNRSMDISDSTELILDQLREKGSGSLEYYSPSFNRWEIAGFLTIPEYGWGIWAAAPRNEVLLPLYRVAGLFSVLIIIGATVILVMRYLLVVNISRPLTELNAACQEFTYGNLNHRVKLKNDRLPLEIMSLGESLNYMAASVQHTNNLLMMHRDDLEERVDKRTRELLIKNKELSVLYAVASSVRSTNEFAVVLYSVLEEIVGLFEVRLATIWAKDEMGEKQVLEVWSADTQREKKEKYLKHIENICERAIHERKPVTRNNLEDSSSENEKIQIKSLISVPILQNDSILGVLTLASYKQNRFGRHDVDLLQAICNQLGAIISNVILFNVINKEHNTLVAVINSMNEGLVLFDANAKIIYANPIFVKQFKIRNNWQEMTYQQFREHLDSQGANISWEELWDDFVNKRGFPHREAAMSFKEKTVYYMLMGFPVLSNGDFVGYGYIIRDITHDKEVDSLKNSILSTVSHELRTPLTTIRGCAESLLRKEIKLSKTEKQEFLTAIVDESKRLRELIENIMDMSKIESGALNLDVHLADLGKLIERVIARFRMQHPSLEIIIEYDKNIPFVNIDERRIEQVVNNLVENGIKYSGADVRMLITAEYSVDEGLVKVSIADNGIGIDDQYREAIFERFYRINTPLTKNVRGSGVGLSIAKGIIEAHGGTIWAESQMQKGTTFTFTIPCKNYEGGMLG